MNSSKWTSELPYEIWTQCKTVKTNITCIIHKNLAQFRNIHTYLFFEIFSQLFTPKSDTHLLRHFGDIFLFTPKSDVRLKCETTVLVYYGKNTSGAIAKLCSDEIQSDKKICNVFPKGGSHFNGARDIETMQVSAHPEAGFQITVLTFGTCIFYI